MTIASPTSVDPRVVESRRDRRRTIIAASAGNFVEWYDAGVYGITATVIAMTLFPATLSPTIALLNTYGVFAISYLLRPIGGLVFGRIADKLGRKRALSVTIIITSLATGLIGLIPTYQGIGWLAPIILLLLRLIQSMGTGGEYTTAISFVYEHGEKGHKARSVGALTSLTFVGFLIGALFSTILTATLPGTGYSTYGWRILFLLAIPMGLIGLYLRRRTEDGPEFKALQKLRELEKIAATPIKDAFRLYWGRMLLFFLFMGSWSSFATLLTNYLPTFLKANKALNPTEANAANLLASVFIVVFVLLFAPVADRIGLKNSMIIACVVLIIGIFPGYLLAGSGLVGGFVGAAILGLCKGVLAVPILLAASQIFPAGVRVTAGGFSYNMSSSILGGTAPFVAVWLNSVTGNSFGFSAYLVFFGVVTLVITLICARRWIAESASHSGDVATRSIPTVDTTQASASIPS
jgi:MHS family proline/betaine transporter-like MFS transporter